MPNLPSPLPPGHVYTPVTPHYQDVQDHCGYACACMLLDHHGLPCVGIRGLNLSGMSQMAMHAYFVPPQNTSWYATPGRLVEVFGAAQRSSVGGEAAALASGVHAASVLDYLIKKQRPTVVLQTAAASGEGTHWVVVNGLSQADQSAKAPTTGYFLNNPWVPALDWAYDHQDCYALPRNFGLTPHERYSGLFLHQSGGGCRCPQWHQGVLNPVIEQEWLSQAELEQRVEWARTDSFCHVVGVGKLGEMGDAQRAAPPSRSPEIRLPLPLDATKLTSSLRQAGLIGPSAPDPWRSVTGLGPLIKGPFADGRWVIAGKVKNQNRHLWVVHDASGILLAAGLLRTWPRLVTTKKMLTEFRTQGDSWCQKSGIAINLTGATSSIHPHLIGPASVQSQVPWWPLYRIELKWGQGPSKTLYVDLHRRVFEKLTLPTGAGG